jgi:hypothetical protein
VPRFLVRSTEAHNGERQRHETIQGEEGISDPRGGDGEARSDHDAAERGCEEDRRAQAGAGGHGQAGAAEGEPGEEGVRVAAPAPASFTPSPVLAEDGAAAQDLLSENPVATGLAICMRPRAGSM